jgi:hypothetical protein
MSPSTTFLRPFSEACIGRFLELASTYYPEGHDARNEAYLRWAFLRNPAGAGRVAGAETEGGRWSAMMGLVPFRIRQGKRTFLASMVVNVLVHPDHRKEKLFVKMIQKTLSELSGTDEWLIGHPNEAATPGWKRTNMGFRNGYDLRVVPPLCKAALPAGERIDSSRALMGRDLSPLGVWQESLDQPVIAADAEFLAWRFLEHPTRKYRVFVHGDGTKVLGYRVDHRFKSLALRRVVDWQGEDAWRRGPVRGLRPAVIAWPRAVSAPALTVDPPRPKKHYEFFATPCRTLENDGVDWRYLTLAASDFG